MGREKEGQRESQRDRQVESPTGSEIDRQRDRQAEGQVDRLADRLIDRQAEGQTDKQRKFGSGSDF